MIMCQGNSRHQGKKVRAFFCCSQGLKQVSSLNEGIDAFF